MVVTDYDRWRIGPSYKKLSASEPIATNKTGSMNKETNNPNDETPAGERSWFERNVNLCIAGLVIACVDVGGTSGL